MVRCLVEGILAVNKKLDKTITTISINHETIQKFYKVIKRAFLKRNLDIVLGLDNRLFHDTVFT